LFKEQIVCLNEITNKKKQKNTRTQKETTKKEKKTKRKKTKKKQNKNRNKNEKTRTGQIKIKPTVSNKKFSDVDIIKMLVSYNRQSTFKWMRIFSQKRSFFI
jgi:hypothetical protein